MRTRALAVALTATVVGGASIAIAAGGAPAMHTRAAEHNHRAAQRDVRQLLEKVVPPAGATVVSRNPSPWKWFTEPQMRPVTTALVDVDRFWRVANERPGAVLAWFQAHPPAGSSRGGSGSASGPGYTSDSLVFQFPSISGAISSRQLVVSIAAARGGGTAVRVDAEDVWFVPRPKRERVPAGVAAIELVDHKFNFRTGNTSTSSQTVTDAARVAKIVADVNALPPGQPGVEACPADVGPNVALKFYDVPGGPIVAEADADGSGCGTVAFKLAGRTAPYLTDGSGLIAQLDSLLGAHL
ncbi:MAG TPA: hypothetical protein VG410_08950 [Solirubrobacteraceae bacterium]|jgi:hypothetical protein|nr:hypothetical protein [Solirubrobacteraceae bacterium]